MKIHASRDSVAAGDDCDDHDRQFSFPDSTTIEDAISRIVASSYLASIMGGCATWSATSGFPIAVIAQQWPEIRAVSWQVVDKSTLQTKADDILLHFNYHQQIDPEIVHKILKQAQPKVFFNIKYASSRRIYCLNSYFIYSKNHAKTVNPCF